MFEIEIRKAVKDRYSKIATSSSNTGCCVDGESCSADSGLISLGASVPVEASSVNAGCGSPISLISLKEGDTVLDLGSGGGIDVFRASQLVGARGKAIGVDATPEMVWRARETRAKYGDKYANAEFRLGEIEHLPIESDSVDHVISNCVINLSPDKLAVFREAFRVLKGGGTFAVADITLQTEIPESARMDMDAWSACLAGALTDSDYRTKLLSAGFVDAEIEHISDSNIGEYPFKYYSSHIRARKPDALTSRAR
ncbi:MAG: methyltransferase domain-containing protein [Nitrososphaerota archaeon]|nr:methyltransferase domain-containing protein [Nitrososphaerota archaeon]